MEHPWKSGIFDRRAEIKDVATGKAVASIHHQFLNAREIVFDKQTCIVEIHQISVYNLNA